MPAFTQNDAREVAKIDLLFSRLQEAAEHAGKEQQFQMAILHRVQLHISKFDANSRDMLLAKLREAIEKHVMANGGEEGTVYSVAGEVSVSEIGFTHPEAPDFEEKIVDAFDRAGMFKPEGSRH